MSELFTSAEAELTTQRDGFWPCRSRSYLMELLYFIFYSYLEVTPESEVTVNSEQTDFSKIVEYLNEHIEEPISLDTLTKEFMINRNKLNDLFMKQSSMTCLNYLLNLDYGIKKGEVDANLGLELYLLR